MHKKPPYRTQLMHMVAFLPVPPQQLFPSGGFLTFTLIGPWSDPVALFFVLMLARLLPIGASPLIATGWLDTAT
ncbi:protein of unknown function [Pseudorhizobium banfieldiae]|uniref:Uncharacterized protein n=1 Tax=Pseudorhizobium banfieldiae TaxID=1125847 RepID=L0NFZ7_9HYPH|nr:protein of unknown function [Pseudorhizobium banfieldiae]